MLKHICLVVLALVCSSGCAASKPRRSIGTLADVYYWKGVDAWEAGDASAAHAAWVKFFEVARRDPSMITTERRVDVAYRLETAKAALPAPAPVPETVIAAPEKPVRRVRKKKEEIVPDPEPTDPESTERDRAKRLRDLNTRAAKARRMGKPEQALRLYKLMVEQDPESEEARKNVKELEEELH